MPATETELFVERTYESHAAAGTGEVRLRVFRPERDPEPGGSWRCRVRIDGVEPTVDQHAYGEDGLQALVLALEMARVCLRFADLPGGASLRWMGDADLGIPVMLPGAPA
jgi:hypothetical protein